MADVMDVCVCGHDRAHHKDNPLHSACVGVPGHRCMCAGFSVSARCDFCSGFPVVWSYPTTQKSMAVPVDPDGMRMQTHVSHAGWACCSECSELIERDNRRALSQRMLLVDVPPDLRGVVRARMRQMHRIQFFDVRTGERVRVG